MRRNSLLLLNLWKAKEGEEKGEKKRTKVLFMRPFYFFLSFLFQ